MKDIKSEVDRASPDGANQTDEDKNAESTRSQNVDSAEVEAANPKPINLFTDQLIEDMIKCNVGAAKGAKPVEEPSTSKGDHENKDAKFKNAKGAKGNAPRRQRERNFVNSQKKEPQTDGNLPKNCLRQCGKLYNADRTQYVKRRQEVDSGQGNLLYSAKFKEGGVMWKLHGEAGLLTSSNEYVAQVTVRQLEELDLATTFNFAKGILRKNLKVTKVLLDEHHIDVEKVKQSCDEYLKGVFANTIDNVQNAEDLYQLESILKLNLQDDQKIITAIKNYTFMSDKTKQIVMRCFEMESRQTTRNRVFNVINSFLGVSKPRSCVDILRENVRFGIESHKAKALEIAPGIMRVHLTMLLGKSVLFVTRYDLKLFSDMINAMDNTLVKSMMFAMVDRYFQRIKHFSTNQLTPVLPFTNQIFFYLCKSVLDVSEEVAAKTSTKKILHYDAATGWRKNVFNRRLKSSALDKCLDHELNLLLKLLNHFEVGRPTSSERFPYKFKIFENIESNPEYKQVIEHANKAFGHQHNKKSTVLPDELHVWICLLDDTIAQFFSNDEHIVKLSSALLKLYMNYSLSGQMSLDSLESLRVITHNTIRFVAQAGPFVHPKNEQDNYIIMKQIGYMNRASLEGRMSFTDYRDLIEVFAQYWKQRSDAIDGLEAKLPGDCFKHEVEAVQSLLMQCLAGALDKNVKLADLISFCRVYEELLVDVHNLPLDWFVRMPTTDCADIFLRKGVISVVENKWKDSDQQCYRVKDFEKFERVYRVLFEDVELPRNYLVETIKALLKCINSMEEKKHWKGGLVLTESDQLIATGLLITSVRKSLLYLKEQADYISFDRFLEENTKPFVAVSNDSSSFEDFKKRITLIKESYWYIRNLNVIDIDTALKLFRESNESDFNEEYLRLFYRKYSEQFEKYMTQNDTLETTARIAPIVAEVKRQKRHYLAEKWNVDFKFNVMPVLLAGLSAVWSLHVSKDVASSGQYLKPHCVQILCVSRLLSTEKVTPGVRKHLAQVLTGQGKSLVLALVAAILALCGHSVQVMCYSKYLATRDEKDFEEFYNYFDIRRNITYQTFGQAAGEHFEIVAGNAKKYVHRCIGLPKAAKLYGNSRPNPVLLIDEVDVFFDDKLYGENRGIGSFPSVSGLDKIQLKIWELVKQRASNIRQSVDFFINFSACTDSTEFNHLMDKSGQYSLLTSGNNECTIKHYSNATLFSSHLDEMISTAEKVYNMKNDDSFLNQYQLNRFGNITKKKSFGNYSETTYYGYYNTFIYFRLKQTDFEQGKSNFGYFNFHLGSISYAKLPENFPLILGVSGTLTTLSSYEKKVVKDHYNITDLSVMPSFFGGSNLKFNETQDFSCLNTVNEWMNAIFGRINMMVYARRSVLVVFDTDLKINAFKQQFAAQLDRLNVLTVDTDLVDKERFINDAGVSRTITLATREMGRGVDYKSSVAVESNGGVHVIQTFFSVDIKEETQIKGRTARKDNRGSYELIVCIDHLQSEDLVDKTVHFSMVSYTQLNTRRNEQLVSKEAKRDAKLKIANEKHDVTAKFYKDL
ncbi:uncharacterized protein LOC6047142 [Culex quinquefasciatus]|uniref:uncharacterized protein LOC6047142 n=1 Tax=Culex quinquefasciatus TaxID=7176 RepID=UPI0018E37CC1|nr:uncharacterized protein LOC6047142 [Culex quinquefasciatus]